VSTLFSTRFALERWKASCIGRPVERHWVSIQRLRRWRWAARREGGVAAESPHACSEWCPRRHRRTPLPGTALASLLPTDDPSLM